MRNTFINNYRKNNKQKKIVEVVEEFLPHHLVKGAEINKGDNHFVGEDIIKALNMLSADYYIPFTKYFEGYKYLEIADELAIPIGTVKTRIHIARKLLKRKLRIYGNVG